MIRWLWSAVLLFALSWPAAAAPPRRAQVELLNSRGQQIGALTVQRFRSGVWLQGEIWSLPPGPHAFAFLPLDGCHPRAQEEAVGPLPNVWIGQDGTAYVDRWVEEWELRHQPSSSEQLMVIFHGSFDHFASELGAPLACGDLEPSGPRLSRTAPVPAG